MTQIFCPFLQYLSLCFLLAVSSYCVCVYVRHGQATMLDLRAYAAFAVSLSDQTYVLLHMHHAISVCSDQGCGRPSAPSRAI
jgi:hypothetical protein